MLPTSCRELLRLGTSPALLGVCWLRGWAREVGCKAAGGTTEWKSKSGSTLLLPMVGEMGAKSCRSRITAWVGDRRKSSTGQRLSVSTVITSKRWKGRRKGSQAQALEPCTLPVSISGFCLSVTVGAALALFYYYWFGCGFSQLYTLNTLCEGWGSGLMKCE